MNSGTITNQLLDAVQVLVDDAVKKAEFDRTVQAVIAKCVSATKGQYSVKYQGGFFYAYAQDPSVTYTPETQVYVLIPGNDMNKTKTILGTVEKLGENFIRETDTFIFENVGNNICSDDGTIYGLKSYLVTDSKVLYDSTPGWEPDPGITLNTDINAAELYLKNSDYLIMAAKFRTNLPQEHRTKGNYGLKYTLTFTDPLTGENVDRTYVLDINNMLGNPYAQAVAMRQFKSFEIDSKNFLSIKKIEIFSEKFTSVPDESKPEDIFITDIELNGALTLPVDEKTGYILSLITKQGIYFKVGDADNSSRRIEAELYKNGEKQDITTNDVVYYWFKEDASIYFNTPGYLSYGGQGWKCINELSTDNKFLPGQSYIDVLKINNPAKENKYKCVVVFKNTTLWMAKEITIYNQTSNYTVTLTADVADLSDAAAANLTCTVTGVELSPQHTLSFDWSKSIDGELPAQFVQNDSPIIYTHEAGESVTLPISLKEAVRTLTYKCSVRDITDPEDPFSLGTATITITRGSEQITGYYYITMVNDNQVFKYDTHGDSPTNKALINPQVILPLSFVLYDPDGQQVPFSEIGSENVTWEPPTGNSMLIVGPPEESYIDGGEKLRYDIKGKYDVNATNNTIKVRVEYDGKIIRGDADILFLKEGENGSNGTSYTLQVIPNCNEGDEPKGRVFYYYRSINEDEGFNFTPKTGEFPFRTKFYKDGELIYDSGRSTGNVEAEVKYDFIKRIYTTYKQTEDSVFGAVKQYYKYNPRAKNYILLVKGTDYQVGSQISSVVYNVFEKSGVPIQDRSRFEINEEMTQISCNNYDIATEVGTNGNYTADILRCSLEYQDKMWYYYYPIIFVRYEDAATGYDVVIPETSGFTEVVYTEDSHNPQYKGNNIFDINVYQNLEPVTTNVHWTAQGQIFTSDWQEQSNLIVNSENGEEVFGIETYDGNCVTNALYTNINNLIKIHFPIAMYLNVYGNEFINEWNGNAIELNEEGGIILTPQLAAGHKEEDNSFTGVVGGKAKESSSQSIEQGLFGYYYGERTFELNAEDGSAKFGKSGAGQIIISPDETNEHSVLQSGGYVAPVLTPSGQIAQAGTGLQIDLTEPSITFGSGLFRVDKDGHVYATEYATIRDLSDGNVTVNPSGVTGLTDTMNTVTDLDNTITKFQVDLDTYTMTIPCESNNQTINGNNYVFIGLLTYKGEPITSYSTNNVVITAPSGITTSDIDYSKDFSNGIFTITFTTKGTIINTLTNEYICEFYYPESQETVTKKIVLTLAPKGEVGETGEDATSLYINSSNGLIFKNNLEATVLTVVIYHGASRIVDVNTLHNIYGQNSYLQWKSRRTLDPDYTIIPANDPRLSDGGFTLTLSASDIDEQVTFICELMK